MAKALMGYMHSDLRTPARLTAENNRLRARVADLEDLVVRLQAENDRLAAAQADLKDALTDAQPLLDPSPIDPQMQPA